MYCLVGLENAAKFSLLLVRTTSIRAVTIQVASMPLRRFFTLRSMAILTFRSLLVLLQDRRLKNRCCPHFKAVDTPCTLRLARRGFTLILPSSILPLRADIYWGSNVTV